MKIYKTSDIVNCIINNDLCFLKEITKDYFIYSKRLIINLLISYKNKIPISCKELENIITNKENKILRIDLNSLGKVKINYQCVFKFICRYREPLFFKYLVDIGLKECQCYFCCYLASACETNNTDMIKFLVENGALDERKWSSQYKTWIVEQYYKSSLILTYRNGNIPIMKFLIEHGADINGNATKKNDNKLITYAIRNGDIDTVKYIYENPQFHDDAKENGETSFITACKHENEKIIDYFIKNGYDINKVYKEYYTPLIYACNRKSCSLIDCLIRHGVDVNAMNQDRTAFSYACSISYFKMAQYLIKCGADINKSDSHGNTPLMLACRRRHSKEIKFLIENGADVKRINNHGDTPLMLLESGINFAKYFIKNGCNVNEKNNDGDTPLILACRNKRRRLAKYYINSGAYINATNKKGESSLLIARHNGDKYLIKLLIENGADSID